MKRSRLFQSASFAAIAASFLYACSSDSSSSTPEQPGIDASPASDATTGDAAQDGTTGTDASDAGSDPATPSDAAKDAPVDAPRDAPSFDAGTGGSSTIFVVRVGDGTAALSAVAAPVFLEERRVSDGSIVRTIALPVAASGQNQPFTASGSASSEGALTRSTNKKYVTLAGYGSTPGTAAVSTTTTPRVVARVDATGAVDTTTTLGSAFSANNVRCAFTDDGTAFWVGGSNTAGGVVYSTLGAGTPVTVLATPTNMRVITSFGAQLYGTSGTGGFQTVLAIGTGEPTTAGQTAAPLPGEGTSGSPYAFALLDRDTNVAGLDTLYVADDGAIASGGDAGTGGGIHKWTFDGTTWSPVARYFNGLSTGVRGLAADVTSAGVVLYATTAELTPRLVAYVDDGVTADPAVTVLDTAGMNTAFRGVALAPVP